MAWFAVRSVLLFGKKRDGSNVFEERVVCFRAEDVPEAHDKARIEAEEYAEQNDCELHEEQVGYAQDGDDLIDGYELWSRLYESPLSLAAFYRAKYEIFRYRPE